MAGLDIRIGNDKQPAPVVPTNVPLYNLQTGKILTDEGGTPLVSEQDIALLSEAVSSKSTPIVLTSEKPTVEIKNRDLTGSNFQAVNSAILSIELSNVGNGYAINTTDNTYNVPAGNFAAEILYDTDSLGQVTNARVNPNARGFNYVSGQSYSIGGTAGTSAVITISTVVNLLKGENCKFTTEISSGDGIKVPTGLDQGAPAYENRRVQSILNDNELTVSLGFTNPRSKTPSGGLGTSFGRLIKIGSKQINTVIPIEEQFATFSEVSTTILGYPKAEEQLGLFSNVSSYGLDDNEFLFYRRDNFNGDPFDWATRRNRDYGNHYDSGYLEEKEESAIIIRSYKTPWTFPTPPGPQSQVQIGSSPQQEKFCNFLKIGCLLYEYFKPGGDGAIQYGLTDFTYASNFVPWKKTFFTVNGSTIAQGTNVSGSPYFDEFNQLITPFFPGEEIYDFFTWNNGNPTGPALGTLETYSIFFNTIHFNEDIGFLHSEVYNNQDFQIIGATSGTRAVITSDCTFNEPTGDLFFANMLTPVNPQYPSRGDFFDQIDTWTETWRDIRNGSFRLPDGGILNAEFVDTLPIIQQYITDARSLVGDDRNVFNNSLPGGTSSTNRVTRAYLVSRQAFRYQPGRISGFTFGVRASGDASTNAARLEWGIGNDTDELMFQINGANLYIVRRSVVPLSDSVMERNALDPGDPAGKEAREASNPDPTFWDGDQYPIILDTQNNDAFTDLSDRQAYEVKIPRDNWNGDPLNGNGPSGWNWTAEDVTMYKIEFGWYGAIGVRFYAYVPIENGEARWVKLHTLVIENQLNRPSMGDPYFKFKYALLIDDQADIRSPQFIYKYGTSCYIDGGDEGTVRVGAITSSQKSAPVQLVGGVKQSSTVVGLIPKTVIYNSLGIPVKNKQNIYPKELSLQSNGLTEISLVKCTACPGYGHSYQTNLSSGYLGDERFLRHPDVSGGISYDRSRFELPILKRVGDSDAGSNIITLTSIDPTDLSIGSAGGNPLRFLRVGDVVVSNIFGGPVDPPYITAIDTQTNQITLSASIPDARTNFTFEIQPVFIGRLDEYAKIIGNGIYLTYVGNRLNFSGTPYNIQIPGPLGALNVIGWTETRMVTIDTQAVAGEQLAEAFRYHIPRELPSLTRGGGEVVPTKIQFAVRLSQYKHVAGSTFPVVGKDNSMLFLLPNYGVNDTGTFSNGQYSDWRMGVTTLKPVQVGDDIVWYKPDGTPVDEFTDEYKLYAERFNEAISRSAEGFETGEWDTGRTPAFTVDYRIPQPPGTNTGRCSFLRIEVEDVKSSDCEQLTGNSGSLPQSTLSQAFAAAGYTFNNGANDYYLRFVGSPPFDYNPTGAEIGFNPNAIQPTPEPLDPKNIPTIGSGVQFTTDFVSYQVQDPETGQNITYIIAGISGPLGAGTGSRTIYFIPVVLTTFRKLARKSFDYNPFPLYFFIEFRDGCRINGPIIREITQVENTYNPRWVGSSTIILDNSNIEIGPVGETKFTTGDTESTPPNFTSPQRLSSALIDTQSTSQLRPYEVVDRFYVGNQTKTVDLRAIFDYEKESITPDLLNTTAYFFIATSREASSTNVSGTLNYIEQQ